MMDDELIEKVARAIMAGMEYPENPDTPCSRLMVDGTWKVLGPLWEVEFEESARAAIQAVREAGWVQMVPQDRPKVPQDHELDGMYSNGNSTPQWGETKKPRF